MEQIFIHENNFDRARKLIKENQSKKIIFSSDDDELNRKILERQKAKPLASSPEGQTKENINVLLLNQAEKKDFQKQRNSGLNHVLAKLAKKNNVVIGINLDEIIKSSEKDKARILARVSQNIRICNKNKLKMKFIILNKDNERNVFDLKSLGLVLGMPTNLIKEL